MLLKPLIAQDFYQLCHEKLISKEALGANPKEAFASIDVFNRLGLL